MNPVDTARQSVVENGLRASIAKTLRSLVSMPMGSEIGSRGKQPTINGSCGDTKATGYRELGSMASRVEEYEKLLRLLYPRMEAPDQALIQRVLEKVRTSSLPRDRGSDLLTQL